MAESITRDMKIADVVQKHPEAVLVFLSHGLMCLGCAGAQMESIEEGAGTHGIELEPLMVDLNAAVKEQTGKARTA